jgi:hypothetical protein
MLLLQGSVSAISERDALIDFYDATNGDLWVVNSNWKSENDIDSWAFVAATGDQNVIALDISSNNLQGEGIISLDI